MNSQSLILTAIEDRVSKRGLTLLNDRGYANTGTLRVLDSTLRQVGAVSYDFQGGYCTFSVGRTTERVASLWYGQTDVAGAADWVVGSIPDLVDTVVEHLLKEAVA
jgi:hypothetical protein